MTYSGARSSVSRFLRPERRVVFIIVLFSSGGSTGTDDADTTVRSFGEGDEQHSLRPGLSDNNSRCSYRECVTSGTIRARGSLKTEPASTNEIPCLRRLARSFRESHSNAGSIER